MPMKQHKKRRKEYQRAVAARRTDRFTDMMESVINGGTLPCACCGHQRRTEATTSTHAENLALRWAMEIARKGNVRDLTFRTDCQAAFQAFHMGKAKMRWTVEQIPRGRNRRADHLASAARRSA